MRRLATVPTDDGRIRCGATLASHHSPSSCTVVAAVNRDAARRAVAAWSLDRLVAATLRFGLRLAAHLAALAVGVAPGGEVALVGLVEVHAAGAVGALAAHRRGAVRSGRALRHRAPWHGLQRSSRESNPRATARATLHEQPRTPANRLGRTPWSEGFRRTSSGPPRTHQRNGRDSNPRALRPPAFKAGAIVRSATVPPVRLTAPVGRGPWRRSASARSMVRLRTSRERCQRGRMGRPAKALTAARWSVGSNPTLSAAADRHLAESMSTASIRPPPTVHRRVTRVSFVVGPMTLALRFRDERSRPWPSEGPIHGAALSRRLLQLIRRTAAATSPRSSGGARRRGARRGRIRRCASQRRPHRPGGADPSATAIARARFRSWPRSRSKNRSSIRTTSASTTSATDPTRASPAGASTRRSPNERRPAPSTSRPSPSS